MSYTSVSTSSESSCSVQYKLKRLWERVQSSNPLLANVVDVGKAINNATIVEECKLETEDIIKQVGTSIFLALVKMTERFYVHLFTDTAEVWAEVRSSKDDKDMIKITVKPEEAVLLDTADDDVTDPILLDHSSVGSEEWPRIVYSVIKTSMENFLYTPYYSKELLLLYSCSSEIASSLAIVPGDVLCIKQYRTTANVFVRSLHHFGVYVGKMKSKKNVDIEHAVIHVVKNKQTGDISIDAVELEGNQPDKCFALKKSRSGCPPLLFKIKYESRAEINRNETVARTLNIYRHSQNYFKQYSLTSNNCEDFVNVCVFGKPYCEQRSRLIMTTLPNLLLGSSVPAQFLRAALVVTAEATELATSSPTMILTYLGESLALAMSVVEFTFRTLWDIYLLKRSGRLTRKKVQHLVISRLASIAPELLVGIISLLVSIICALTAPIGTIIGISSLVIMIALRFTVRSRIERWFKQREVARLQNFRQWETCDVARLALGTSEDDDIYEDLLVKFESKGLSGEVIYELMCQDRMNPTGKHLLEALQFLSEAERDAFKTRVSSILYSFDLSKSQNSKIYLTYKEQSVTINTSCMDSFTVNQLLDMARLHWKINFKYGDWQLYTMDDEETVDEEKVNEEKWQVTASCFMEGSLEKKLDMLPDLTTNMKLTYQERSACTLQ